MSGAITPSAWVVCADCGAVVADADAHAAWHADLDARLAAPEPAPAPAPDSSSEGV